MENTEYTGSNLVFIVGSPRSGTTYLQKLLFCHPQIKTGQETDIFDEYIGPLLRVWRQSLQLADGRGGVGLGCYWYEEDFLRIVKNLLLQLLDPILTTLNPGELFVEKTPSHAFFLPEIMEMLPKARVLHIVRDPRDVVASLLSASRSWGNHWAPGNARRASQMWNVHVQAVRQHQHQVPRDQFYEVKFEELYASPIPSLQRLQQFLGLEWDAGAMQQAVAANTITASRRGGGTVLSKGGELSRRTQATVVQDPPEFYRKGVPGSWRQDLTLWQKFQVWRVVRKAMKEFQYS
jgi:hypothetical protein